MKAPRTPMRCVLSMTALTVLLLSISLSCGPAEPVPIPTVCIDIPGETAEAGPTTKCFTPSPTPLPPKYAKLDRELNEMVELLEAEAESRAARNAPKATRMPAGSGVAVRIYTDADRDATTIKEWLESEGAEVNLSYGGEGERRFTFLSGHIDGKLLVPLALREEITSVEMQGEMSTDDGP